MIGEVICRLCWGMMTILNGSMPRRPYRHGRFLTLQAFHYHIPPSAAQPQY